MWKNENLGKVLKEGGVVVMPTDTLYGVVGSALNQFVVERIYNIRKRNLEKPCIILISDITELDKFSIHLYPGQKKTLSGYWPAPISAVIDCENDDFFYLHRGTRTLAFRVPENEELRILLTATGPLIAPSANLEARPPSRTISEAKEYFGDKVDLYIDGGEIRGKASKVIKLRRDGSIEILRA